MGDGTDFASYLVARWPALVRTLVLLGSTPAQAEADALEGMVRGRSSWERVRGEGDVDVWVYRTVLDARGRGADGPVVFEGPGVVDPTIVDLEERVVLLAELRGRAGRAAARSSVRCSCSTSSRSSTPARSPRCSGSASRWSRRGCASPCRPRCSTTPPRRSRCTPHRSGPWRRASGRVAGDGSGGRPAGSAAVLAVVGRRQRGSGTRPDRAGPAGAGRDAGGQPRRRRVVRQPRSCTSPTSPSSCPSSRRWSRSRTGSSTPTATDGWCSWTATVR